MLPASGPLLAEDELVRPTLIRVVEAFQDR